MESNEIGSGKDNTFGYSAARLQGDLVAHHFTDNRQKAWQELEAGWTVGTRWPWKTSIHQPSPDIWVQHSHNCQCGRQVSCSVCKWCMYVLRAWHKPKWNDVIILRQHPVTCSEQAATQTQTKLIPEIEGADYHRSLLEGPDSRWGKVTGKRRLLSSPNGTFLNGGFAFVFYFCSFNFIRRCTDSTCRP